MIYKLRVIITNNLYKESRLLIQGFNNIEKEFLLYKLSTI